MYYMAKVVSLLDRSHVELSSLITGYLVLIQVKSRWTLLTWCCRAATVGAVENGRIQASSSYAVMYKPATAMGQAPG
jgi:hypothetical protein